MLINIILWISFYISYLYNLHISNYKAVQPISYIFKMRKETEITLYLNTITASENLAVDPQGYLIKIFMSCSSVSTKVFKIHSNVIKINQTLKVKNINAK